MLLDESNYNDKVKDGVVLVDFYATWCGPCNAVAPVLERIEKEYAGRVTVGKVNIGENSDLADQYGITAIPTFFFYKNGQIVKKTMGSMTEKSFKEELDKLLAG
jgi:thioredoxin 1